MGLCDPKAIRDGKAWADVVNKTPMNPPLKLVLFPERSLNKINDLAKPQEAVGSTPSSS